MSIDDVDAAASTKGNGHPWPSSVRPCPAIVARMASRTYGVLGEVDSKAVHPSTMTLLTVQR